LESETFEFVYLRWALYVVFVISLVMWFATIFAVGPPTDVAGVIKHEAAKLRSLIGIVVSLAGLAASGRQGR
jgi:hypothetical protein